MWYNITACYTNHKAEKHGNRDKSYPGSRKGSEPHPGNISGSLPNHRSASTMKWISTAISAKLKHRDDIIH